MDDLHLYNRVAEELEREGPHQGLWAKAFAESAGDKSRAEALYLRMRVSQFAALERASADAKLEEERERIRAAAEQRKTDRKARVDAEGVTALHWILMGLALLFSVLLLLRGSGAI